MRSSYKGIKRALSVFALVLLCLLPAAAMAATGPENVCISVTKCEDGQMPRSAVEWYKKKDVYYFFLPGGTDWNELRIWFEGKQDVITVNGAELKSGDRLSVTGEGELTFVYANAKYRVSIVQGSGIGAAFIETESGDLSYIHKSVENKEAGTALFLRGDGTVDYDGGMSHIKMRGNTSVSLPKKNYGIKLEKGADLMGLGKAKRWVFLGSYRDHSQLRNQIVYTMAQYAQMKYSCDVTPVDLYLNHAYNGTYLMTEKIEVNKERVDIRDLEEQNENLNDRPLSEYEQVGPVESRKGKYKAFALEKEPEDVTGGYIIEYENWQQRYTTEACAYTTLKNKVLLVKEPEHASVGEMEYISSFMQGYENAIFSDDGKDPETGKHYSEFVDFDSLVTKYMLEEISLNEDGSASSQYYVKPADEESTVAFAGPAWDYDITFGGYAKAIKKSLLNPKALFLTKINNSQYWWPQLYKRQEFFEAIREKWESVYKPALRILLGQEKDGTGTLLSVREYAADLKKSAEMNFIRWPIIKTGSNIADTGMTFDENIDYLIDFMQKRFDFLDSVWGVSAVG